jgi:glutamine cyclotransferase
MPSHKIVAFGFGVASASQPSTLQPTDDTTTTLSTGTLPDSYVSSFRVLSTHPHCSADTASGRCTAFTEGLAFDASGTLYESTGGYEGSSIRGVRRLDLATGDAIGEQMPPRTGQFAEGLTVLPDDRLLQLTYRENQLNIYRTAPSLEFVRTTGVTLGDEGWGLTRSADGQVR